MRSNRSLLLGAVVGVFSMPFQVNAQSDRLNVNVLDEENAGVASVIYSFDSKDARARIGETKPDGHLSLQYNCDSGFQILAEPKNSVKYFSSQKSECTSSVLLRVIKKSTSVGNSDGYVIRNFSNPEDRRTVLSFASKIVIVAEYKTLPAIEGMPLPVYNKRCSLALIPRVETSIFQYNDDKYFDISDMFQTTSDTDKNLRIQRKEFNASCEEVADQISLQKAKAVESTKAYINNVWASPNSEKPNNKDISGLVAKFRQESFDKGFELISPLQ